MDVGPTHCWFGHEIRQRENDWIVYMGYTHEFSCREFSHTSSMYYLRVLNCFRNEISELEITGQSAKDKIWHIIIKYDIY